MIKPKKKNSNISREDVIRELLKRSAKHLAVEIDKQLIKIVFQDRNEKP
jgi:hypothetical protein